MSVDRKVRRKLAKLERINFNLKEIAEERQKIQESLQYMDQLEHEMKHEIDHIDDYFIDHYVEAKVYTVEVLKDAKIDVCVACVGRTVYASFNGIVCSAKAHPDDEFIKEVGESIAVHRLINKVLELSFGFKM